MGKNGNDLGLLLVLGLVAYIVFTGKGAIENLQKKISSLSQSLTGGFAQGVEYYQRPYTWLTPLYDPLNIGHLWRSFTRPNGLVVTNGRKNGSAPVISPTRDVYEQIGGLKTTITAIATATGYSKPAVLPTQKHRAPKDTTFALRLAQATKEEAEPRIVTTVKPSSRGTVRR